MAAAGHAVTVAGMNTPPSQSAQPSPATAAASAPEINVVHPGTAPWGDPYATGYVTLVFHDMPRLVVWTRPDCTLLIVCIDDDADVSVWTYRTLTGDEAAALTQQSADSDVWEDVNELPPRGYLAVVAVRDHVVNAALFPATVPDSTAVRTLLTISRITQQPHQHRQLARRDRQDLYKKR